VPTRIALLRAVNVGGVSVAMADLRAFFEKLGFESVRTLLQTGNVVFESRHKGDLERFLEAEAAKRMKLDTDFLVRDPGEWNAILAANPFPKMATSDPGRLVVMPLKDAPSVAGISALRAAIRGPERVEAGTRHLYLTYPDGQGRSKLTIRVIESKLGTRGTARNWNTARKIAELAGS
jgi:uncharacterized protein (DUF1697 family)